jgi:hypothetical protein
VRQPRYPISGFVNDDQFNGVTWRACPHHPRAERIERREALKHC